MLQTLAVNYIALPAFTSDETLAAAFPAFGFPVLTFERDRAGQLLTDANGQPHVKQANGGPVLDLIVFDPTRPEPYRVASVEPGAGIGQYQPA